MTPVLAGIGVFLCIGVAILLVLAVVTVVTGSEPRDWFGNQDE